MSIEIDPEIEQLYQEYYQSAKSLGKGSMKVVRPYLIVAAIFLCGGVSSLFWAGYRTMVTLFFWGIVLEIAVMIVGLIVQRRWIKNQVAIISQTKPGFDEFMKLYNRRGWRMGTLSGSEYQKFLSITGRSKPKHDREEALPAEEN